MKPRSLTWREGFGKLEAGDVLADTALGQYSLRPSGDGRWTIWFNERCVGDRHGGVRESHGLEEARTMAQMHFNGLARRTVHDLMEPNDGR